MSFCIYIRETSCYEPCINDLYILTWSRFRQSIQTMFGLCYRRRSISWVALTNLFSIDVYYWATELHTSPNTTCVWRVTGNITSQVTFDRCNSGCTCPIPMFEYACSYLIVCYVNIASVASRIMSPNIFIQSLE